MQIFLFISYQSKVMRICTSSKRRLAYFYSNFQENSPHQKLCIYICVYLFIYIFICIYHLEILHYDTAPVLKSVCSSSKQRLMLITFDYCVFLLFPINIVLSKLQVGQSQYILLFLSWTMSQLVYSARGWRTESRLCARIKLVMGGRSNLRIAQLCWVSTDQGIASARSRRTLLN